MMKTLPTVCALILLLGSCAEPDAAPQTTPGAARDVVSEIEPGMTRGEVEQILRPFENEHAITAVGGTGSGYVMKKYLKGGRVVVLNFRAVAGADGPRAQDVLTGPPVVEPAVATDTDR